MLLATSYKLAGAGDTKNVGSRATNIVNEFTNYANKNTMDASNTAGESSSSENSTNKVSIEITNVVNVATAFGNNGHRVTTITKDTLVNPKDVNSVHQDKARKLEEAQNPNN